MGQRAQGLFKDHGIEVIVGAPVDTPDDIVREHLNNNLQTGTNICDH